MPTVCSRIQHRMYLLSIFTLEWMLGNFFQFHFCVNSIQFHHQCDLFLQFDWSWDFCSEFHRSNAELCSLEYPFHGEASTWSLGKDAVCGPLSWWDVHMVTRWRWYLCAPFHGMVSTWSLGEDGVCGLLPWYGVHMITWWRWCLRAPFHGVVSTWSLGDDGAHGLSHCGVSLSFLFQPLFSGIQSLQLSAITACFQSLGLLWFGFWASLWFQLFQTCYSFTPGATNKLFPSNSQSLREVREGAQNRNRRQELM